MKQRMVDYLVDQVYRAGAEHIFFVPGSGCMFLTDALARNTSVTAVSMHHEQAAGMAAVTYAKCTNTLGACIVTTGCGGTNAITALLDSWQDSVPCLFISGQAARHQTIANAKIPLRQMGRQEANIIEIVKSICKYAVMINDPADVAFEIDKAIAIATSGRKGPVWIDVPMDIQNCLVETDTMRRYPVEMKHTEEFEESEMLHLEKMLAEAKRPVLLAGNGIRLGNAVKELDAFIHKYRIPLVYSRLGHDLMDNADPLSIGMVGMLGASRAGNFALANSDLVLCVGCRLSIDTTGYEYDKFARGAKIVVVDIDRNEHMKQTVQISDYINCDAKAFLGAMNVRSPITEYADWAKKCLHWKDIFPVCIDEYRTGDRINMYYFAEVLGKILPDKGTVISDAGNAFFTISPVVRIQASQRSITSGAQAEMGYALPAAIGASYACDGKVIAVCGDGSVMMNLQELETLAFLERNVVLCIMNNNGYSCIRHMQNNAFRGRQIGCDATTGIGFPCFEKVAAAFGLQYMRIENPEEIEAKLQSAFRMKAPVVVEVMCISEQPFLTVSCGPNSRKRIVNRPLEDLYPFISREQLREEMIIAPLD